MEKIDVAVPAWYVLNKKINFESEISGCIGSPLVVISPDGGRLELPSPAIGFFALLELIDSQFFRDPGNCPMLDVARAIVCLVRGKSLLPVDLESIDSAAFDLLSEFGDAIADRIDEITEWLLETPFNGFEMLRNSKQSEPEKFLFSGPALASVVSIAARYGNVSAMDAIWHLPLFLVGHLAAANDCGKLPPKRPKDAADLAFQMKCAIEREQRGELHPWQEIDPASYPLSARQLAAKSERGEKL